MANPGGPTQAQSVSSGMSTAGDIFGDYPGPEIASAQQIVSDFFGWMGWPQGIDADQVILWVMQQGIGNDPYHAYQALYDSTWFNDQQREAAPGAQFGLDATTYQQRSSAVRDVFSSLIDTSPELLASSDTSNFVDDLFRKALSGNYSQQQVMNAMLQNPDLVQSNPWLVSGQTFRQAESTYHSLYGATPVAKDVVSSWWRFNTASTQLQTTERQPLLVEAQTRKGQSETR